MRSIGLPFGELLRRYRGAAGLTQQALADRARLSVSAVSTLERGGRRSPHEETVGRLADALALSPADRAALKESVRRNRSPSAATHASSLDMPSRWVPAQQLPPPPAYFAGRQDEIELLLAHVSEKGGSVARLVTVQGLAGVGKTTLVVKVARMIADQFPDGQLYVDLQGFGRGRPMSSLDAVGQLLRGIGVPQSDLPTGLQEASALLRTSLVDRRVLLILDNAATAAQVEPVLPAAAGCAVLVASRRMLTSMPATDHVHLQPFSIPDCHDLLGMVAGRERVRAELDDATRIAELCTRLPLAISIVASRLAARPGWRLGDLATRLADESTRLDELRQEDTAVRSALAVSVEQFTRSREPVDSLAWTTFALLGVIDTPSLSESAAARLIDKPLTLTGRVLDRLADLHLIESLTPSHFRMHDLLRIYARELAAQKIGEVAQWAAVGRLLDLYAAASWRATELADPASTWLLWAGSAASTGSPDFGDPGEAYAWLDRERDAMLATIKHAGVSAPSPDRLTSLVLGLAAYFVSYGGNRDWMDALDIALRSTSDERARAMLWADLGAAHWRAGELVRARVLFYDSAAAFRKVGDLRGEAMASNNLSGLLLEPELCVQSDSFLEAGTVATRGLELGRMLGDERLQARSLGRLGSVHLFAGEVFEARECFTASLAISERIGYRRGIALGLHDLGKAQGALGDVHLAIRTLRRAVAALSEIDYQYVKVDALDDLGEILLGVGEVVEAIKCDREALTISIKCRDVAREARANRRLGMALLEDGQRSLASTHLTAALEYYLDHDPAIAAELARLLREVVG